MNKTLSNSALFVLTAITFFLSAAVQAQGQNCPDTQDLWGGRMFNSFYTINNGCLVQVSPIEKPNLVYREYIFDEGGRMVIANSIEGDDMNRSLGERAFWLFPRGGVPKIKVGKDEVVVTFSGGQVVRFNATTPFIAGFDGVQFNESPVIGLQEQGGFEFVKYPGIYLDGGWKIGGLAYRDSTKTSEFVDSAGKRCMVANTEIFDYESVLYSEPILKFQTDDSLFAFLRTRCPNFAIGAGI